MSGPKPVRVLSANLHTTSRAPLVVPWLWSMAVLHRVDVMTLQEVTPRHSWWLRKRPGWVLIQARPFTEAVYARRRLSSARRTLRPLCGPWSRNNRPGLHPGRSLPLSTIRGWLVVGSIHLPPSWVSGPEDRMHAGAAMLLHLTRLLPALVPLYLDGDWNAPPPALNDWRNTVGLPTVRGFRIVHAAARLSRLSRPRSIGRAPGMDHDAHVTEVTPS